MAGSNVQQKRATDKLCPFTRTFTISIEQAAGVGVGAGVGAGVGVCVYVGTNPGVKLHQ